MVNAYNDEHTISNLTKIINTVFYKKIQKLYMCQWCERNSYRKIVVSLILVFMLSHQYLKFYAATISSSALFSFGVKYPNTAIGILFGLFK